MECPSGLELKLGRIYKIICKVSNDVYVGSTFLNLDKRRRLHKSNFGRWLKGTHPTLTIFPIMKKYGINNCELMLIKEYQVCDKRHLEVYETLWILKLKSCNQNMPFSLKFLYHAQYREMNRDRLREGCRIYYHEHKEQCSEYGKQYYQEHKEYFGEYNKQYYQEHKDRILDQVSQWREENKDKMAEFDKRRYQKNKHEILKRNKEPFTCECGAVITLGARWNHFRSKKHLAFQIQK